jgi:hypothetical protein
MHFNWKFICLLKFLSLLTCSVACLKQRNSHWRVQSFVGHPQTIKNGSGMGSAFPGKFDENNVSLTPTMLASKQKPVESDPSRDIACKSMDQPELGNKGLPLPMPASVRGDGVQAHPLQGPASDAQSIECPLTSEALSQREELIIEGGTISISSVYSQGWVLIEVCEISCFQ